MLLNFFTNLAENKIIDVQILGQLIMSNKHNIKTYDYKHTTIRNSDISIHLDYINPIGLNKSPINILIISLIPNIEILEHYLHKIDYVLCKTRETENYFREIKSKYSFVLKYLGWTAFDKLNNGEFTTKTKKNYYTIINNNTNLENLMEFINKWPLATPIKIYSSLISFDKSFILDLVTHPNVDYIEKSNTDLTKDTVYIHLDNEPFDYQLLMEASTGSLLVSKNDEFVSKANYQFSYRNIEQLIESIRKIDRLQDITKGSNASRDIFINNQREFLMAFTEIFTKIFQKANSDRENKVDNTKEDKTNPLVSIVTPTYNRQDIFRIAKYVWNSFTYENREWIIVDDSPTPMNNLPIDNRIKYLYCGPERMTIGAKRNFGIERSSGEYIMCMDDDDFYPASTIEHRLELLKEQPDKQCSYASSIACYDIYRKFSFINTPSLFDPPHKRISEATLFFKKDFWMDRGFPNDIEKGEGENFIEGRYKRCLEIDWVGTIISLIHTNNISQKFEPSDEPNGNHFNNNEWGMNEEFIKLLEERS